MKEMRTLRDAIISAVNSTSPSEVRLFVDRVLSEIDLPQKQMFKCQACGCQLRAVVQNEYVIPILECADCGAVYARYEGTVRTSRKSFYSRGPLRKLVSIRAVDVSGAERLIVLKMARWSADKIELKSKDRFSITFPVQYLADQDGEERKEEYKFVFANMTIGATIELYGCGMCPKELLGQFTRS